MFALNLWTLAGHPTADSEWTLARKLEAIQTAGFSGVCSEFSPELMRLLPVMGMRFSGLLHFPEADEIDASIQKLMGANAETINVQLGAHDQPFEKSLDLVMTLMAAAERHEANVHLETHRNTCTETPEKTYALADTYHDLTGKILRLNMDFSHFAVVKHLRPGNFSQRLLERPELLQNGNLVHCRPFNGHHCQLPATNARGELTSEMKDYLSFAEAVFHCWLAGPRPKNELWVVPELGPVASGYGISTWPSPWEDAVVTMSELRRIWDRVISSVTRNQPAV